VLKYLTTTYTALSELNHFAHYFKHAVIHVFNISIHSGAILLCCFTATTNQNSPRRKKARWCLCLFTGRLVCARACLDAQGPGCDSAEQWRLSGSGLHPACKQHIKRPPLLKKTSHGQEHEIFAQESTPLSTKNVDGRSLFCGERVSLWFRWVNVTVGQEYHISISEKSDY